MVVDTFANMTRQISMIPWLICDILVVVAMVTGSVISSSEQFSAVQCVEMITILFFLLQLAPPLGYHGGTGSEAMHMLRHMTGRLAHLLPICSLLSKAAKVERCNIYTIITYEFSSLSMNRGVVLVYV